MNLRPFLVELPIAVKTYDVDFAGVVSNLVIVRWLEDLRLALGEAHYPVSTMLADGIAPTVIHTSVAYKAPVRFGDEVKGLMWMEDLGPCRWRVEALIEVNDAIAAEAVQICCFTNLSTHRLARTPKWLRERYAAAEHGEELISRYPLPILLEH